MRVRNSPISCRIFTATAVLDKARTKANSKIDAVDQPTNLPINHNTINVVRVCSITVATAIRQIRRNARKLNSMPITNKSNNTPRSARSVIFSWFLTNAKPAGPKTTPASIYPITAGWRNLVKITPHDKATRMTTASGINCSWASIIRLI